MNRALLVLLLVTAGCGGSSKPAQSPMGHALFVAHEGVFTSYDIASGQERAGAVQNVAGPIDLQSLADGTQLVNLTANNQILAVDPASMLEKARLPSSGQGATRPVHSYITPDRSGHRYWISLNDGAQGQVATNSARFVDVQPGSATYLQAVGEVGLGIGHHKASFSNTIERAVFSNIADCNDVLSVYDYADIKNIKKLLTIRAVDLGWDGSTFARTCDPTYANGVPPAPHGCATSKVSGKAYCNLTGSGDLVSIAIDATPVTYSKVTTGGSGGGYTKAHPAGRYIFSLEEKPREGSGGAVCQVGQLVVLDATTDAVVKQLPLGYTGPGCTKTLTGTDEATAGPGHMALSLDAKTLFITLAGGFQVASARVRQVVVVDISNPASPVQLASIPTGASTGHHGDALSGDGKWLFVADNVDNTVTQIDVAARAVAKTIPVRPTPQTLATFGSAEGPSAQTGPIQ